MQKNTATKWVVFAFTTADNLPKTGDAAQITGSVRIDGGADNAIDDTNPAELAGGYYVFDITAAECNGDNVVIIPASSTAGVQVIGVPGAVWTNASVAQTGDNYARIGAPAGASVSADVAAVKSDSGAIKTKTDFLPSATAGAAGGVFIAGSNAATSITTALTANITGTLSTVTNVTNNHAKYMLGAVWIDSVNGAAGSSSYVNGIMSNPVDNLADAKSIADNLKLKRFWVQAGSTLALGAAYDGYVFEGFAYKFNTTGGTRSISDTIINNAYVGTAASVFSGALPPYFSNCEFGTFTVTIPAANLHHCEFSTGVITLGVGNTDFIDCSSIVPGTSTPSFTIPAGTVNVSFRRWSGGISITGITSATTIGIDMVSGGTVTLAGADGNVQIRGMVAGITDNRTGTPTLGQNAAINITKIQNGIATSVEVAALPADVLAAAVVDPIEANIKQVNDVTIQGTGAVGTDEWRKV